MVVHLASFKFGLVQIWSTVVGYLSFTSFSNVLPAVQVGYQASKPIERVVYYLIK